MKLTSVQVLNYKLCKDVVIPIDDEMNVLLGKNGAGKTTLLQAIHLLSTNSELSLQDTTRTIDTKNYDLTTIIASIFDEEDGKTYKFRLRAYFDKDLISNKPKVSANDFQPTDSKEWIAYNEVDYYFFHLDLRAAANSKQTSKKPNVFFERMQKIYNFITDMTYVSSTDFLKAKDISPTIQLGKRGVSNARSSKINRFLLDLHQINTVSPKKFNKFKNIVSRVGSGLVDNIELIDMHLPKSSVQTYRNGILTTLEESQEFFVPIFSINNNKLYSNQLSEGTFRSLALIFYILNHKSNILVIEEPELSVHLELLVDIVELMKNSAMEKQIIISTHSERIINMLEYKNITIVKRAENGIEANNLLDKLTEAQLKSFNNYLSDGGELAELLFSEV